ncbi:MAG: choice-of-anchor Q domain-containing protein [Solirubrobacterales bacterium]
MTAIALSCAAASAGAATYEPTRLDDPIPGACKPSDCSLREALRASNDTPDHDTVVLGEGTYELELPHELAGYDSGSFDLVDGVTFRGRGPGRTIIDANGLDQVMTNWINLEPDSFRLEALTLTGGDASVGSQNDGGAIHMAEGDDLVLSRVRLTANSAPTSGGGVAAFGDGTEVAVKRSVIAGNQAQFGGGIGSTASTLLVKQSTISQNTAVEGGGIDLRPAPSLPATTILASTVSGNTATNKAGGILADGLPYGGGDPAEDPDLYIKNSTIAENKAANDAGGVMGDNLATVAIDNSSIGFNRANNDNIGTAVGGGVYQHSDAIFSVDDSVLASNEDGAAGGDDNCSATEVFSGAGNVLNSTTGCITSFTTPFNAYSASEIAQPLAANGGPTKTMKIKSFSAAVGFANECPKRDQRGKRRPANCDSGAYENKPK